MAQARHRQLVCHRIANMPQGLGRNLYATLSVEENLQFVARSFGHNAAERRRRIDRLSQRTGLFPFLSRPAGKLFGGMKQKLGLCCALIHDPDLLILDEPTIGVDPLARVQFWELIGEIRAERPGMSVIVATATLEEALRFDWLVALDAGRVLAKGTSRALMEVLNNVTMLSIVLTGAVLHVFATTSLGIFMATVARSMPQFGMLAVLILLPLQLLSGNATPRESMPGFLQTLMEASPTTHFVLVGQAILFRGAGLSVVWPSFLALAAIGTVLFAISLNRFRKTINQMS